MAKLIEFNSEPDRAGRTWTSRCGKFQIREILNLTLPFRIFVRNGLSWKYLGSTDKRELAGRVISEARKAKK